MKKIILLFLCVCLGCPQPPGTVDRPRKPDAIVATDEQQFMESLIRAIEAGDFDDTDSVVLVAKKAADRLKIKKLPKLDSLDVSECQPLKTAEARKAFAEKLK